jgi:hypothetical protein
MHESSTHKPAVRQRTERGFQVQSNHADGTIEVRADVGVTADQMSVALALYVPAGAKLESVTKGTTTVVILFRLGEGSGFIPM